MPIRVRCNCGYSMELPDEWAGKQGRCPKCGKVLQIPPMPGGADSPGMVDRSHLSGPVSESFDSAPDDARTDDDSRPGPLASPVWLAVIGGGVLCVVLGLFLAFRNPRPANSDEHGNAAEPSDRVDRARDDVFRPAKSAGEAVGDDGPTNSAADAESPRVATTKSTRTSPEPTKSAASWSRLDAWNTFEFGVYIPVGAAEIEIDGVLVPVRNADELAARGRTGLVLPLGRHVVRFARTEPPRLVEPKRWFLDAYREAAAQLQVDGQWDFDQLLELSRRKMERFTDPLAPHLWGSYYWQEGQFDAAARHYTWALAIAPTFAPSYLNLAQLAHERGDHVRARRLLRLAELWNVQNAFGLAPAATALRSALDQEEPPTPDELDEPDWYVAERDALSARDRDMLAVLKSAAEFAPRVTERAKILNNLGAYFEHAGRADVALEHYRAAAGAFGDAKLGQDESFVVRGILENMTRVCRKADMAEYRRYERLQGMIE